MSSCSRLSFDPNKLYKRNSTDSHTVHLNTSRAIFVPMPEVLTDVPEHLTDLYQPPVVRRLHRAVPALKNILVRCQSEYRVLGRTHRGR